MLTKTEVAFAELLERQFPAAPQELLLLGEFPAELIAFMSARGWRLTRAPWRDPENQVLPPGGINGELVWPGFAGLAQTQGRHFDAVLALDLAADIHPLALFDQLNSLLAPGAVAVLAGKVAASGWLVHAVALGSRCGFALEDPHAVAASAGFVQVLRRAESEPRWHVDSMRSDDFAEIAALFQEVFGHPMSRALWDWKYGSGRGNAVVVRSQGKIVGHYGAMYRPILLHGKPDRAAQVGDVMVQPQARGVLTRNGPFFLMASSWAEIYGVMAFGFPTERALLVAEKMGLYTKASEMAQVRWEPSAPKIRFGTRVKALSPGSASHRRSSNALWAAMAQDLRESVLVVRDWAYLEQRYFAHPHNQYEVLMVTTRLTGKPLGIVVLRRLEGSCELLDVIAPLANLAQVIDQARRLTGRWGLPYLYAWITKTYLPLFVKCDGQEEALNISVPAICWTADPRINAFKDKWWLMSGDTDFR